MTRPSDLADVSQLLCWLAGHGFTLSATGDGHAVRVAIEWPALPGGQRRFAEVVLDGDLLREHGDQMLLTEVCVMLARAGAFDDQGQRR